MVSDKPITHQIIMKSFKKIWRLSGLIILIVLASVGLGIGGGIPIPPSNKKEDTIEIKAELVKSNEDKSALTQFDIKQ